VEAESRFDDLDSDRSGFLEGGLETLQLAEWSWGQFHPGEEMKPAHAGEQTAKIMERCDKNGNGSVDRAEFVAYYNETMRAMHHFHAAKAKVAGSVSPAGSSTRGAARSQGEHEERRGLLEEVKSLKGLVNKLEKDAKESRQVVMKSEKEIYKLKSSLDAANAKAKQDNDKTKEMEEEIRFINKALSEATGRLAAQEPIDVIDSLDLRGELSQLESSVVAYGREKVLLEQELAHKTDENTKLIAQLARVTEDDAAFQLLHERDVCRVSSLESSFEDARRELDRVTADLDRVTLELQRAHKELKDNKIEGQEAYQEEISELRTQLKQAQGELLALSPLGVAVSSRALSPSQARVEARDNREAIEAAVKKEAFRMRDLLQRAEQEALDHKTEATAAKSKAQAAMASLLESESACRREESKVERLVEEGAATKGELEQCQRVERACRIEGESLRRMGEAGREREMALQAQLNEVLEAQARLSRQLGDAQGAVLQTKAEVEAREGRMAHLRQEVKNSENMSVQFQQDLVSQEEENNELKKEIASLKARSAAALVESPEAQATIESPEAQATIATLRQQVAQQAEESRVLLSKLGEEQAIGSRIEVNGHVLPYMDIPGEEKAPTSTSESDFGLRKEIQSLRFENSELHRRLEKSQLEATSDRRVYVENESLLDEKVERRVHHDRSLWEEREAVLEEKVSSLQIELDLLEANRWRVQTQSVQDVRQHLEAVTAAKIEMNQQRWQSEVDFYRLKSSVSEARLQALESTESLPELPPTAASPRYRTPPRLQASLPRELDVTLAISNNSRRSPPRARRTGGLRSSQAGGRLELLETIHAKLVNDSTPERVMRCTRRLVADSPWGV